MLDLKDKKLLYELGLNARMTNKALAKKIALSESSTLGRINNLIRQEILLGTQTIIDNSKLGYEGYRIYFKFSSTTTQEEAKIFNWLKINKTVSVLAKCSGAIDGAIICWTKEKGEFEEFVNNFKGHFRSNLEDLDISVYCGTYHFSRDYLLDSKAKTREIIKIGNNGVAKYDELDEKILRSIFADARKSVLEISEELKQPPRTVAFRIKQLEKKKVIAGYTINLNAEGIGYEYYKLNIVLSKNIINSDLLEFAIHHKNTIYLDKTIGKYDLELNVELKSKLELNNLINEIKDKFGGVKEMSWFQVERYLKINYL
ncbi:MAG: Lrp/AsnC family transcriptional regulator [Nanoarchaeota archaeon]